MIHSTAIIENCQVGTNVKVGAFVIMRNVIVGDDVVIHDNVVIDAIHAHSIFRLRFDGLKELIHRLEVDWITGLWSALFTARSINAIKQCVLHEFWYIEPT